MINYDVIIVGAGIVGLSTALKIIEKDKSTKILILEKETKISFHQSGRNSGVIHSGIYYKPNSLKAVNCIKGRLKLIDFCNEEGIKYDICGKLIVATSNDEINQLFKLKERGINNGLKGIKILSKDEIKEKEPHTTGLKGLLIPQSGIVDYKEVAKKIANKIIRLGGEIFFNTKVLDIIESDNYVDVITPNTTFNTKRLISCAGLYSDRLARKTNPNIDVRITPFRGEYFLVKEEFKYLVKNLIYPVPNDEFPFLGVHFTRMINGDIECGPNAVFAFSREGYSKFNFNFYDFYEALTWPGFLSLAKKYWREGMLEVYRSLFKEAFVRALQKLVPEIRSEYLIPTTPGIRAQACSIDGKLVDDFYFVQKKNIIHVCNAPSPAATASLSIGEYISDKYREML